VRAERRAVELVFRADPITEQLVIAAAMVGDAVAKDLSAKVPADAFLAGEHRVAWASIQEAVRRGLSRDPATLSKLADGAVEVGYLAELLQARPSVPDEPTLKFHVGQLMWDRQRHVAMTGPVAAMIEAVEKNEAPERVRALARSVSTSFDGWSDRKHLHEPEDLIASQMIDLRHRMSGRAVYPFGIQGLDFYDNPDGLPSERRRLIPGVAPGLVTVVTGVPGSGKSTTVARLALGLARQKRKVLFGAWEMRPGTTLELLACLSLDWSRSMLTEGLFDEEKLRVLEERMRLISRRVRFLANPFRRRSGAKPSNERNLDAVQGYLADSGCDVFVADLWKRCLVETRPEDEEEALYRQQAMAEEMGVHCILVQQQRSKEVEQRVDKRPTREGIKGSGAWTEVPDNILGVHRPALWKPVPDDVLEIDVLKQRYGKWPLAVEFGWDPDKGAITGGRSIEYDQPAARDEEGGNPIDKMVAKPREGKGKRR
jgi:replicative DNA helicase